MLIHFLCLAAMLMSKETTKNKEINKARVVFEIGTIVVIWRNCCHDVCKLVYTISNIVHVNLQQNGSGGIPTGGA